MSWNRLIKVQEVRPEFVADGLYYPMPQFLQRVHSVLSDFVEGSARWQTALSSSQKPVKASLIKAAH